MFETEASFNPIYVSGFFAAVFKRKNTRRSAQKLLTTCHQSVRKIGAETYPVKLKFVLFSRVCTMLISCPSVDKAGILRMGLI